MDFVETFLQTGRSYGANAIWLDSGLQTGRPGGAKNEKMILTLKLELRRDF
jgi:hypothetical protein